MRGFGGRPVIRRYDVRSTHWRAPPLTVASLTDLHVCHRWSPLWALDRVIDQVLAAAPDLIVLPGDFLIQGLTLCRPVAIEEIAQTLQRLRSPLGVFASLGNHDWKDCGLARGNGFTESSVALALQAVGIPVLINAAVQLSEGSMWLVGLDSQEGHGSTRFPRPRHDVAAAFADVPEGASAILMAHEPDIFLDQPTAAALQLSGHTHAGQIALGRWRPATPSRYGGRLAHGLHSNAHRHLIVSAGLGYTGLPIRVNARPEIVLARIAAG